MKTIIAGTDFTKSSENACLYAAMLAKKLGSKLTLFNVFEAPLFHSNVGLYGFSYSSIKSDHQHKTHKTVEKLRKLFPEIEINFFVSNNSFKYELENFIASHQVEAAVMGLQTKTRISKFIYGSNGTDIAGKIETPVIIVPEKYKTHRLSKVLLAVDNNDKLFKSSLVEFEKLLHKSKIKPRLLHVRSKGELFEPVFKTLKINGASIPVNVIKANDIQSGIKKFCAREQIDLVAIISKKHSAFYNLFVESTTKQIAFVSKVPILAIHE